jgi:cyclopentanol dehydrogenase
MTNTRKIESTEIEDGLSDTVSIVTGGARGNGEAQAKVLSEAGSEVYVVDILEDGIDETVREIKNTRGMAYGHKMDVSVSEEWDELIQRVRGTSGRLDILVNNAGIASEDSVTDEEIEVWDQVIDANLKGTWLGMKYCIPLMEDTGGGSVINISSVYGLRGSRGGVSAAYQATKGGVTLLTKNAANGYADSGVRVNSVHPGYIETPMTADSDDLEEVFMKDTPMKRSGSPEEVAKSVYFLASDLSSYVTGENLVVDGGYLSH